MKNKAILIIGGVATLGLGAFFFWRWKQGDQIPLILGPGNALASVNPNLLNQPSSAYPVTAPTVNRQDNASEPWATSQTKAINQMLPSSGLGDANFAQNVALAKGAASIVDSVSSIWNDLDLSSLWSDGGSNIVEEDTLADFSWDNYSTNWSFS